MKTIGLIGGMTPQSTILYYQLLNSFAANKYGEKHSCKVIIHSVDFGELSNLQTEGKWDVLDEMMAKAGKSLLDAGAECILITANTMHLCIKAVENVVNIPVIHIAESTAKSIKDRSLNKVALLGTKYTMEKTFYTEVLNAHGIDVLIPKEKDRNEIHRIIYSELAKLILLPESKEIYLNIIQQLIKDGAEGIILGCTEIPLLINQDDVSVPVFDTTKIHASTGFEYISS